MIERIVLPYKTDWPPVIILQNAASTRNINNEIGSRFLDRSVDAASSHTTSQQSAQWTDKTTKPPAATTLGSVSSHLPGKTSSGDLSYHSANSKKEEKKRKETACLIIQLTAVYVNRRDNSATFPSLSGHARSNGNLQGFLVSLIFKYASHFCH